VTTRPAAPTNSGDSEGASSSVWVPYSLPNDRRQKAAKKDLVNRFCPAPLLVRNRCYFECNDSATMRGREQSGCCRESGQRGDRCWRVPDAWRDELKCNAQARRLFRLAGAGSTEETAASTMLALFPPRRLRPKWLRHAACWRTYRSSQCSVVDGGRSTRDVFVDLGDRRSDRAERTLRRSGGRPAGRRVQIGREMN
jgi:hypothetical protein